MSQEQILGIIRHILTFVGGYFVTKGLVEEGMSQELVGGVMTLIGTVWSIVAKIKKA